MNSRALRHIVIFVVVVLLQSFVFSRLPLGTCLQPAVYAGFILLLPIGYPLLGALLWAFVMGLCIDLLTADVVGLHAAASVALAFVRPQLLKLFLPKSELDAQAVPAARMLGWRPFLGYATAAVLLHQTLFFFLDSFGFHDVFHTLLRVVASTVCTVVFIALLPVNRKI